MTRALDLYRRPRFEERNSTGALSIVDWAKMFRPGQNIAYAGNQYATFSLNGSNNGGYYQSNSVVFACTSNRILLFSEARFQYQRFQNGRPGDLFGDQSLIPLEQPWVGATTGELLARAELDVTCYGNSYWVNDGPYLQWLDPCKVVVLTEAAYDPNMGRPIGERLLAYGYKESRDEPVAVFLPDEIAHYKPYPSMDNRFVGMSWLNPCLPDVAADSQITEHKQSSLVGGAQIPYVITLPKEINKLQFDTFVDAYRSQHEGAGNAGKTLFLTAGADIKTVGQTFSDIEMKATQGAGETRIAACSGVPPVIVGLSEGLASATYSNYSQARRRLADGTMRPLWRQFAAAMQSVLTVPAGARLWYDDRDIPWLRDDVMDQAEIKSREALTIESLIRAGYKPDTVVDAVTSGDYHRLVHTGLYSVQLQPAGASTPAIPPAA